MSLIDALEQASSATTNIRAPAQEALDQAENESLSGFMHQLIEEFANENNPEHGRQLAGLYFKNLIKSDKQEILEFKVKRWIEDVEDEIRTEIKQNVLQVLASSSHEIGLVAIQCISQIAAIELPQETWEDVLPFLSGFVEQGGEGALILGLQCIGYMCEDLIDTISAQQNNQILEVIFTGLEGGTNNQVKHAAFVALKHCLEFSTANFDDEGERSMIFDKMFEFTACEDARVRKSVFECFVSVVDLYYDKLPDFMDRIFEHSSNVIASDNDEEVSMQATEVWTTIASKEVERAEAIEQARYQGTEPSVQCFHFTSHYLKDLVPVLLEAMTNQEEEISFDTINLAIAAGTCLDYVAQVVREEVMDLVIPFCQENMMSSEWRLRECALFSFGSIMNGPSPEAMEGYIESAVDPIVSSLADEVTVVRDSAAWCIARICLFHAASIPMSSLDSIVDGLVSSLEDESPKVASQATYALHNMALACSAQADEETNVLSGYFEKMIPALFGAADREDSDEENLAPSVYEAISLIVGNSAQDVSSLIGDLFLEFLSRLEQAFNMSTFSTDEKMRKEEMQGMLAGCINVCIGKIDPDLVNEQSDYLMQMLVALLSEEENSAADEAVLAIGQVASALESEFDRHMELLLEPLKKGLSDPSLHHLCSVSAGLIGDIARALDADVRQYSDDFAQSLLNLMHSEPHPSTRPLVIAAFSDLAMSLGGDFGDYVTYVMEVLTPVVEEVIEQGRALAEGEELEDEDEIEQLAELRESLLDVFTGMVQALRDGEKADKLEGDVELIVAFMGSVVEDMQYQTLAHLKQIVGLVGDLGLAFGRPVGPILDKAWLKGLLEETATYEECEEAVEFTESVLSKIFK